MAAGAAGAGAQLGPLWEGLEKAWNRVGRRPHAQGRRGVGGGSADPEAGLLGEHLDLEGLGEDLHAACPPSLHTLTAPRWTT